MGDCTSQNWKKRDGRNNQEQQQQQEKKATYKTAAELAVKTQVRKLAGRKGRICELSLSELNLRQNKLDNATLDKPKLGEKGHKTKSRTK